MNKGTVKFFDNTKGWGYITMENGEDVFIHYSGIIGGEFKKLNDGSKVSFDLDSNERGVKAVNVVIIE